MCCYYRAQIMWMCMGHGKFVSSSYTHFSVQFCFSCAKDVVGCFLFLFVHFYIIFKKKNSLSGSYSYSSHKSTNTDTHKYTHNHPRSNTHKQFYGGRLKDKRPFTATTNMKKRIFIEWFKRLTVAISISLIAIFIMEQK